MWTWDNAKQAGFVALAILVAALLWVGFGQIRGLDRRQAAVEKELKTLTVSITQSVDRTTAIRAEILRLGSDLRVHGHATTRLAMIGSHASQAARGGGVMLFGDSIMEGWYVYEVCGIQAVNAGVGGAGVAFFASNAPALLGAGGPAIVVLALGINDVMRVKASRAGDEDVDRWLADYREILAHVRTSRGVPVILAILPTGEDRPLGGSRFELRMLRKFNERLRGLADSEGVIFIDSYRSLANAKGYMRPEFTTDGVHLTTSGYHQFGREIDRGVSAAAKVIGKDVSFCAPRGR